ncbi:MAG: molybdenum cofactor biosynthesis protein MoaE, partial [Acidobacteria bacterium]|nr:molybdenum cofactor biosynthesis protein MoaE [Acidobacteriota bacterium]
TGLLLPMQTAPLSFTADPLALRTFGTIADEVGEHWPEARVALQHRIGRLAPGEVSLVIAAASPHRAEAFQACR